MKYICIWIIRLYRKIISPLKPSCCRFSPTCSAYAIEAFQNRGFFVGFYLTIKRILRCNPFSKGGYDPVPPKRKRKKEAQCAENRYKSMTCKYDGVKTESKD